MNLSRSNDSGFTLLEVLAVVFIIGLSTGIIVMALPERQSVLQAEAARLEQTIDRLEKRAVLTGAVHALELSQNSYRVTRLLEGSWTSIPQFEHDLPGDVLVELPGQNAKDAGWRLLFDPVGVPADTRISLIDGNARMDITRIVSPVAGR